MPRALSRGHEPEDGRQARRAGPKRQVQFAHCRGIQYNRNNPSWCGAAGGCTLEQRDTSPSPPGCPPRARHDKGSPRLEREDVLAGADSCPAHPPLQPPEGALNQ